MLAREATAALGELLAGAPAQVREDLRAALGRLYAGGEHLSTGDLDIELLGRIYASRKPAGDRRRQGAHYTPRSLTAPIVRATLSPILGACPPPEQILDLKVADPAMGSGAFLLEACRQLAEALVEASRGAIPVAQARRLVAQRCLHGVDKDPVAVALARLSLWLFTEAGASPASFLDHALCHGDALVGLRWEQTFPDVFTRDNPGFDAIVGNPPFAGKNTLARSAGRGYLDQLKALHPGAHGNADLAAHFLRRAFDLLRQGGTFGLIATNTIAQGDTRETGLRYITSHGGTIYAARRRVRWPDAGAAVVVSVVHVRRGPSPTATLDGRAVERVSAYLFDRGGDADPLPLPENQGRCFQGPIALGMGFTFDDTDRTGTASPVAEVARLGQRDPRNLTRIFPYLGGEELLTSPSQAPHRFIIDLGDMSEAEARTFPDLMRILEEKVKPARLAQRDKGARERWWQFIRPRPELRRASTGLSRVLMHPFLSSYMAFAFIPAETVVAGPCNVLPTRSFADFAVLQSRVHEVWVRFFSSSLKDDLRYTPSRSLSTFPFPRPMPPGLEAIGEAYHAQRAALMRENGEGLTATYRRFHEPEERAPAIEALRALHAALDRQILDAYGWTDVPTGCAFLLDYEEDPPRAGKKPWRYRFPDEVACDVLARLIDLNQRRAALSR